MKKSEGPKTYTVAVGDPEASSMLTPTPEGRKCGDCRLCCKLLQVTEAQGMPFQKDQGVWCPHAGDGGCAIYGTPEFPNVCNNFFCGWLAGYFEERHKPTRSKVVVSHEMSVWVTGKPAWIIYENMVGVTQQAGPANEIFRALRRTVYPVVVVPPGKNRPVRVYRVGRAIPQIIEYTHDPTGDTRMGEGAKPGEGENTPQGLKFTVGAGRMKDTDQPFVIVNFETSTRWLAMSPNNARDFAKMLEEHARAADAGPPRKPQQ